MQIRRFLGNIARAYLAIGSLSMAAAAGADEFYHDPMMAAPGGYMDGCCESHCCGCNEPPVCAWGYNPPAYLNCGRSGCEGFLDTLRFRADFLWWRANEECLALGAEKQVDIFTIDDETEFYQEANVKNHKTRYDAGFRIGLATICENCWDIALNWTHYHTTAHARGFSTFNEFPEYSVLFDNYWEAVDFAVADEARSRWTLDLDLIDLEFGHKYYVDHCFVLRPHAGLRGGRVDQGLKVFSFANRISGPYSTQQWESNVHAHNDYRFIGPRVGLDLDFKVGCGVSIYGQAAGSLVFGRFNRPTHENFEDFNNDVNATLRFKDSPSRTSRAITDLAIGLKWDHCVEWCTRCHPVSIAITWEHHAFFDFNNFNSKARSVDSDFDGVKPSFAGGNNCSTGDLFTQGLTVSFEIGF
jgi:hypothetical protein